tara:strand:+ start:248 stop:472 length:225 start_codon:yes stop_codon:yes gene_type:complete
MTDFEIYRSVIFDGSAVESNGVSLCNLENFMHNFVPRAKYQVCCESMQFHSLYFNVDDAVKKFLELKGKRSYIK